MKTYFQIHFSEISEILMKAAIGVEAVCGHKYVTTDMIYSLNSLREYMYKFKEPYYIAIREQGAECGLKEACIDRCSGLGYPIVIAKIEKDKTWNYNMTIIFTHGWINNDNNYMKQEFNSL